MALRCLTLVLVLSGGVCFYLPRPEEPKQPGENPEFLPIFRLHVKKSPAANLQKIAKTLMRLKGKAMQIGKDRLRIRSGKKVAEIWLPSGGLWLADYERLWNPRAKFTLPDKKVIAKRSKQFELLVRSLTGPNKGAAVMFVRDQSAPSTKVTGYRTITKTPEKARPLDIQLNYLARITIKTKKGKKRTLSVFGGGGEFNGTLGNKGQVIGFSGVWRPIQGIKQFARVLTAREADARYLAMLKKQGIPVKRLKLTFKRKLAYYSAPAPVEQKFLYPVYAYQAVAQAGKHKVQLRTVFVPATTFKPQLPPSADRQFRRGAVPAPAAKKAAAKDDDQKLEAGAAWDSGVGTPNVNGFVKEVANISWKLNFKLPRPAHKKSHWTTDSDNFVDGCDLVFFTGHAYDGGWFVSFGSVISVTKVDVSDAKDPTKDLWGNEDAEWIVIAACGPLHDKSIDSMKDHAAARWRDAFNGLHQLHGFASRSFNSHVEGELFVKYCTDKKMPATTINAWLRAAKEAQAAVNTDGRNLWAGSLYAEQDGKKSTLDDHLWGHGFTAEDPINPDRICLILSPL